MLIQKSMKVMVLFGGITFLTETWGVTCPIPASQIKAEWFQIDSTQKEAHAKVRDNSRVWIMNISSKKYLLDRMIIQRTLNENWSSKTADETLGCLRCTYSSNYQYPVDFWACAQ